jgi:hypothetical protein
MEFALASVRVSDATLIEGVTEYMQEEEMAFGELCKDIIRRIRAAGSKMSHRELGRSFQGNVRYKRDLDNALLHLVETEQLLLEKIATGGRPSWVYQLPKNGA